MVAGRRIGAGWGGEIVKEFGMDMYTWLSLKWITNRDPLCSTGNSAQCYVAAWMGVEFGGERIHAYVRLSPFAAYLKLSHHYQSAVLEKTLESPLDSKEIQPVHSEGDQPWDFFGRNDAKAETPVLWPPHAKRL